MGLWLTAAKAAIGGFFILGLFGTHGVGRSNGFFKLVEGIPQSHRPKLPGTNIDMKLDWTGISKLDEVTGVLLGVFAPMLDGQSIGLSTISFHFFSQLYAIWAMILVEGYRVGNAWTLISFVTLFGIIAENVAAAMTFPAWCAFHLILSPTVKASTAVVRQKSLLVHPTELSILPWSIFLGGVLPVILAVLLPWSTKGTSFFANAQFWVLVRQFHPAITAVLQIALSALSSAWSAPVYKTAYERNQAVARALRNVYSIVKYTCIASHIGTLALVVGSQHLPGLFTSEATTALDPVQMWSPPLFWKDEVAKVVTAGDGLWTFLQWDEPVMTLSFLTWAFAINRDALSRRADGSTFLSAVLRTICMTVIGGPTAAAATLLEERDEVLLEAHESSEKKDD